MDSGNTSSRSILDKPLNLLSEDDISHLTREDCRKYLKEKGMRRPSWNKSQAIQQVISLKALLEPTDYDYEAWSFRKFSYAQPTQRSTTQGNGVPTTCAMAWVPSSNAKVFERPEEPILQADEELARQGSPGKRAAGANDNENNAIPSRTCVTSSTIGQMTIFYCGKVNVYDEVPLDKAQIIMHLASSPVHFLRDDPLNKNSVATTSVCQLQSADERRKLKSKIIAGSPSLGFQINQHPRTLASKGNSSPTSIISPTKPALSLQPGSSTDNQLNISLLFKNQGNNVKFKPTP